jgi:hypothetical protein
VKLLLDEMLAPVIARTLRSGGHDVGAIGEREAWVSLTDDEVIELAYRERRTVVTNNLRDFRPLAATASLPGRGGHYGLICVPGAYRRTKAGTGRIVAALEAILSAHPGERDGWNRELWL